MPGTECIILWCLEDGRLCHQRGRKWGLHGLAFLGRTYDAVSHLMIRSPHSGQTSPCWPGRNHVWPVPDSSKPGND